VTSQHLIIWVGGVRTWPGLSSLLHGHESVLGLTLGLGEKKILT